MSPGDTSVRRAFSGRKRSARAITAALAGVVVITLLASTSVFARNDFHRVPREDRGKFTPAVKPLGLSHKPVTVVLQMAGAPVTVVDSLSPTGLSPAQRGEVRLNLRMQQLAASARVRALGGTVTGSYQLAYNGIKVRIAPGKVNRLAAIPNVIGIHRLQLMTPDNIHGVPLVGAPEVWAGALGLHGEGIKVAIIDTGLDYTHADFGGPGTPAAFTDAAAHSTDPANPAWFGPGAPRVKGGVDLVGNDYNADPTSPDYQPVPHPDPNPLDCNGHGTHVAGTAAGSGVLSDGSTYTGPYNATTVSSHTWNVGPGVAPKADLYAIRVFGCEGSTDVTVDAIEWAVAHDMDVINMSLGSPYGGDDDPSAEAADNAAKDGIIVVASAGNNGHNPYITGSPATGSRVISVAASDPTQSFPGAVLHLSTGVDVTAIDANGAALPGGALPVIVLPNGSGGISLGCNPAEYTTAGVVGKLVVVKRGTCARVARAIFGEMAGAAAVVMVNTSDTFPPYEGPITSNPDDGTPFNVTIPFLGVKSSSAAALQAADGGTATLTSTTVANPSALATADFSSGGPRTGDSWLKPDVTAPGVSIFSAGMGTGNSFAVISGTSMASPHTAGVAALVRQAHPDWKKTEYWKAAIVNTADPALVNGYATRLDGSGFVQAPPAVQTKVVAVGDKGTASLNFGFAELGKDFHDALDVTLRNFSNSAVTFNIGTARDAGSPHSVSTDAQVTVPMNGSKNVKVTLDVPAATAGDSSAFHDVSGLITFTPVGGGNAGVSLDVPYYLVPQATSNISTELDANKLRKQGTAAATVTNKKGAVTGAADWYAWGLSDGKDKVAGSADIDSVGIQAFPGVVAFAISTNQRWSNAAQNEFDIFVDVNGDAVDDYDVVGADLGALTAGVSSGQMATAVFDLRTGAGSIQFLADAPFDSTTLVLPALVSQLCAAGSPCLSAGNPRIAYHAVGFNLENNTNDTADGPALFNAFTPAISNGMFDVVAPNGTAIEAVSVNAAEWAQTPPLGLMIVSHDNESKSETQTIKVKAP